MPDVKKSQNTTELTELTDDELAAAAGAGHTIKLENATVSSIRNTSIGNTSITDGTSKTITDGTSNTLGAKGQG